MTALRQRMLADLQLRGLAPKTQQCDIEAVHHLAQHYRRAPDQRSEEERRPLYASDGTDLGHRARHHHRSHG